MSQPNHQELHDQTRSRLIQMFRYVQAFNLLQNPIQQDIQAQPWFMWLHNLPSHPCIRIGYNSSNTTSLDQPPTSSPSSEEDFILKVKRPDSIESEPPREILPWLQQGWQELKGLARLDPTTTRSFIQNLKYKQLFDAWEEKEQAARETTNLYNRLNDLRSQLERESEQLELILGDGILSWSAKNGSSIHHPVLLLRLQLEFNPHIPEFTLKEVDHPTELYTALLQVIPGINPADIGRSRQDFEQNRYHPLEGEETSQFLKRFINQLSSQGEFANTPGQLKNKQAPSITRAPIIFLRKRTQGFSTAIEAILEDLPRRNQLPDGITGLIGITPPINTIPVDPTPTEAPGSPNGEDEHILLSKPANSEQLEIARRLEQHGAVLVQGPPGTGKTHTIANLLGHLLSEGKSVLVTSEKSKALKVVREKVVEPLQPLCVSILDDDSRKQLEYAIDAITERLSYANTYNLEREATSLTRQRVDIITQLKKARQELKEARNSEYEAIVCSGTQYSPTDAARYLTSLQKAAWIPLPVLEGPLPLAPQELIDLYRSNTTITPKDEQQIVAGLPDLSKLLPPSEFAHLLTEQSRLTQTEKSYRADLWRTTPNGPSPRIFNDLQVQLDQALEIFTSQEQWRLAAISAGHGGDVYYRIWDDLILLIEHAYTLAARFQLLMVEHDPAIPEDCLPGQQEKILDEIIAHLEKKKKLNNVALFAHRDWKTLIEQARIKGRSPTSLEHFGMLRILLNLKHARAELIGRWQRQMTPLGGPDAASLGPAPENVCIQYIDQLRQCLAWYPTRWAPLEERLKQQGLQWEKLISEMPVQMTSYGVLLRLKEAAKTHLPSLLTAETDHRIYIQNQAKLLELQRQLDPISKTAAQNEAIQMLRASVNNLDPHAYQAAIDLITTLYERQKEQQYRHTLLAKLQQSAPAWAAAIERRAGLHGASMLPGDPEQAWLWSQLHIELNRRAAISLEEVQERITKLSHNLRQITIKLVETKAWLAQVKRTTGTQRQALNGWKELMRKVGKGKGKRSAKLLAEARLLMPKCQTAVPVWIMPLSRVVQNFDPRQNQFDVVIIDEASQADIKALAAIYMGKQIIIVGDDEQVTPLAVGQDLDNVEQLIAEHLQGIPLAAMYDGKLSIYQLAKTAPGFQPICLREHFRCVSPIIQFSNELSYQGKIMPLRDDSDARLQPSTIAYRIQSTALQGDVNEAEALTVASLLVAATEQPAYQDTTFGVISLLKEAQALHIDTLLRKYLSPTEYTRRQILCGTSAQFQGDERDVMFLSMVDIANANGPLSLRSEDSYDYMYKKRFNVAASRARDQLWVVHSLDPEIDLKVGDIRRKLILHTQNPQDLTRKIAEQARKTDSEFEKQVLRRLMQAGYHVTPQWPAGAYRIDLVVEGAGKRLAIECDGDRWHPIEKLEEDMARQAILERLGWRFVRIRGSQFFRDPDQAMEAVFSRLHALEIPPAATEENTHKTASDGKELQECVIRRAAELRRQWATPATRSSIPSIQPASPQTTTLSKNGNTTPLKPTAPMTQASSRLTTSRPAPTSSTKQAVSSQQPAIDIRRVKYQPSASSEVTHNQDPFDLLNYLKKRRLEFLDNRQMGGRLWIIGGADLDPIMRDLQKEGVKARFEPSGGPMTRGRAAWYI